MLHREVELYIMYIVGSKRGKIKENEEKTRKMTKNQK
jgi:hypothetical protein